MGLGLPHWNESCQICLMTPSVEVYSQIYISVLWHCFQCHKREPLWWEVTFWMRVVRVFPFVMNLIFLWVQHSGMHLLHRALAWGSIQYFYIDSVQRKATKWNKPMKELHTGISCLTWVCAHFPSAGEKVVWSKCIVLCIDLMPHVMEDNTSWDKGMYPNMHCFTRQKPLAISWNLCQRCLSVKLCIIITSIQPCY